MKPWWDSAIVAWLALLFTISAMIAYIVATAERVNP